MKLMLDRSDRQWAIGSVGFAVAIASAILAMQPSWAAEKSSQIPRAIDRQQPAATVKAWMTQIEATVQVAGVKLNPTATGLEIILDTPAGKTLTIDASKFRTEGNSLIVDIPNAVLAGQAFAAEKPTADVASVRVVQQDTSSIRVIVSGTSAPPQSAVTIKTGALVYSLNPAAVEPELEIVVRGEGRNRYRVPNAATATKTDTPLRDIPAAIQVIPQQVIKDQGVTRIEDALRNAVGVTQQVDRRSPAGSYTIRGFGARGLRNGFSFDTSGSGVSSPIQLPNNIEQVEVLRGPDSVLYGSGEPGGTVNYVTKQPLDKPAYTAELTAGQFNFYQPSIDLTGPLTDDKRGLYRVTAAYQNYGSYLDFVNGQAISIAPTISYKIGDDTTLKVEYEYSYYRDVPYSGLPLDPIGFKLPISRNFQYPNIYRFNANNALTSSLEHKFNNNISVRTALRGNFYNSRDRSINLGGFDPVTNLVGGNYQESPNSGSDYSSQTSLTAKFNTGSIGHQLLAGIDFGYSSGTLQLNAFEGDLTNDVFNPTYDKAFGAVNFVFNRETNSNTTGVYLQDQVTLLPNLKLLIGGRYDFLNQKNQTSTTEFGETIASSNSFDNQAFSPRVGLVYQPIEPISLYASFNQSFNPNNTTTRTGELILPTRGTQQEVGIKTEFGNLAANLAAYQITKTNILRTDPIDNNFQIPIGEVSSRGLEFDIGGKILPGWNLTASTFLNESVVTVGDEFSPSGATLQNSPKAGASIWTTYQIQQGDLEGVGVGLGVFYVADRQTAIPNNLMLPAYVRTDASLFYRRGDWDARLNFKNLFNTQYYEGSAGGLTYSGAPFSVLGTVSVRF